jgi:hypothetical protein
MFCEYTLKKVLWMRFLIKTIHKTVLIDMNRSFDRLAFDRPTNW